MIRRVCRCLPLLALLLVSACNRDPFERPGTVAARGLNDANLRAMVVNPADLQQGVGTTTSRGSAAAAPVDRLRRDQRRDMSAPQQSAITLNMTGGQDVSR